MRTKSAYRDKPDSEIPAAPSNIPEVKIDGEDAEPVLTASVETEPDAVTLAINRATEADQAKLALVRQLEALKRSEEGQRLHQEAMAAAQAPQPLPETLEDRIALWRQHGISEAEADFLRQNPELAGFPQVSALASQQ